MWTLPAASAPCLTATSRPSRLLPSEEWSAQARTTLRDRGTPLAPEDLVQHACGTFTGLGNPDHWTFVAQGKNSMVPIRSRLSITTAEAAIDAAIAGLGVPRVLSYQAAAAKSSNLLKTILEPFEPAAMPVSLVHECQTIVPLKGGAFLDFGAPRLKERLAASHS